MHSLDDQIQVFFGQLTDSLAHVYVKLGDGVDKDLSVAGRVSGPDSVYARTLPTNVRLTEATAGGDRLVYASIPDPCFWSPAAPYQYQLELQLSCGSTVESVQRTIGFRRFGPRGTSLFLNGQRWVPRVVSVARLAAGDLQACHASGTCLLIGPAADELYVEASRVGVLLVASLEGPATELARQLVHLARFPAVAIALLPVGIRADQSLAAAAGNILLAERYCDSSSLKSATEASLGWWDVEAAGSVEPAASNMPLIASAGSAQPADVLALRTACDQLQSRLAGGYEFAGFAISSS